ncbi:unnamed protein product [Mytilus edulis]|uniref:Tc1-like transposase DDE domain-containing protein n=1 Tax=Mytilus edulis TaxID=6550 RepID=A0A8S3RZV1_MYTED|nr:unnamed protein product [Mytilus edulis]
MGRKGKELTSDQKSRLAALNDAGYRKSEIVKLTGIKQSTVYSFLKRYEHRGDIENIRRTGRPKSFHDRDMRKLSRCVKKHRRKSLSEITNIFNESIDRPFSKQTVERKLHSDGFHKRSVKKKNRIREVNKKKRVAYCRGNLHKTVNAHWSKVIFSDECKVIIGQDSRVSVWRKVGEEWLTDCICPPSQRKYSLMIWGCITYHGVGTITVVEGNINALKYIEIIDNNLWPVVVRHFPDDNYVFQDDNAPVHRARSVQDFRRETGLKSMNWPAQSPDLNIIENCWWVLKRELQKRTQNINNTKDLEREIRDIWDKLTVTYLKSLYNSIPRRILRVMRNKGNITKY